MERIVQTLRNPTREQLQTSCCSNNNCMKQSEDDSAKVEGQPESEQRTKFHPLPSLQLQTDIFHLLTIIATKKKRMIRLSQKKPQRPSSNTNPRTTSKANSLLLFLIPECFLQKKRRLLEESSHSLRPLKIKCLKSIQDWKSFDS